MLVLDRYVCCRVLGFSTQRQERTHPEGSTGVSSSYLEARGATLRDIMKLEYAIVVCGYCFVKYLKE